LFEILDLLSASNHESEVDDVEDPENPVKNVLLNPVLERDHGDKDQINDRSHDESLGSEPVVMSFSILIFHLIGAVFLK
jgi:hypothetical protein